MRIISLRMHTIHANKKYISNEMIRMFMLVGKKQTASLQFYMYSQYFDLIFLTSVCCRLSLDLFLTSFFSQIKLNFQIFYVFIISKLPAEAFSMIKWFLHFPINRSTEAIVVVYLEKDEKKHNKFKHNIHKINTDKNNMRLITDMQHHIFASFSFVYSSPKNPIFNDP